MKKKHAYAVPANTSDMEINRCSNNGIERDAIDATNSEVGNVASANKPPLKDDYKW